MEDSNSTNTTTTATTSAAMTTLGTSSSSSSSLLTTVLTTSFMPGNTTNDSGSDLSSFEEFCGNSPFWDTDLLLESSYPRFTECFQQVAVTWIPCLLYITVCVPYLLYLYGKPTIPVIKVGVVSVAKMACIICLLGVTIATIIVRATDDDQDDIPDALYVSEGLKCGSFLLHLLVSHVERHKGYVGSPVSWPFWLALTILNIIPFYSNIEEHKDDTDEFGFAIFIVYAILVLAAFIIASFVEPRDSSYYEDLTKAAAIGRPTPEFEVSIPNRLSYWWMTSLVILGFKKTLEEKDVYDLDSNDKCEHLMELHEETWKREKDRVGKYNSKIRLPKKHAGYDGSFKGLNEKSPLLGRSLSAANDQEEDGKTEGKKSPFKSASVLRALLADHGFMLFCAMALKAACDIFLFLNPKITEALLDFISHKDRYHEWRGYALAASYLGVNALSSLGSNMSIFYTKRAAMRMRATLINAIYRKSLTAANIGDDTSKGEISNLMAVDCQRIEDVANFIFVVFSAPAQVGLSLYLLYDQLGVAVFAGMAVLFVTIPVNAFIGFFYQRWQKLQMKYKDQRIKLLTEVLSGIKVLKLYAWEHSFRQKVEAIRKEELRIIRHTSYLIAFLMYFFTALPNLVQVTSFAVHIADKDYLDPTVAFVSLQLFNMLTPALTLLPLLIPIIIQTTVSIERISIYLNKPDIKSDAFRRNTNAANAVEIKNGIFTWTLDQPIPTLRNIEMEVKPGSLIAVVGTVGCGKSSIISAMLGEMERLSGVVTMKGTLAYVPQEAWIQNATLKDNITFGKDFHQRKYDKIIEACALKSDLAILPGGDKTEIGEKGINISGGQKQRVSLARAVYSDRDIFLLDDPLSAVDSHVGKHIFKEVIGEQGVLKKKTRILVTHGIQWLPMVDKIFCVANGEIRESGNYNELIAKDGHFAHFIKEYAQENSDSEDKSDEFGVFPENDELRAADASHPYADSALSDTSTELARSTTLRNRRKSAAGLKSKRPPNVRRQSSVRRKSSMWETSSNMLTASGKVQLLESSITAGKIGTKLIEEEAGESGKVKAEIYLYYLQQLGPLMCAIAVILYLLYAGCSVFAGIWLTKWTGNDYLLNISNKDTDEYSDKTDKYLGVYAGASIGQGIFILVFSFIAAVKMADAAFVLHKDMLDNVLRSPMSFFDTTPIGRLMNRFSRDVDVIDNILPMSIKQAMNVFALVVTTITNISYGTPIFLAALAPLTIIYILIQAVYVPTCRQLRRINAITRSPIYVHFSETLNGAASIRAYHCQERFIRESMHRVNHNIKFYYASVAANSWLSFRLQLLGNLIIFAAAIFAVSASDIDTGVVGLSVSYATSMTQALEQLVNSVSECETNIVSVERLKEYSISPQEAKWSQSHQPRAEWPDKGNIVFDNYQTRYRPGLDLVLKDITCTIKGGEKIGIVGRTGAGKSSMTVALFRIIEPAGGKIIIDGEDISSLGLHDLRNKITILPQDPVIFSGTLRMNLDPFDAYSEPKLWDALEHSYLKDFVEALPAGLDYECGEEGSNLSVGQRQLVCLARTLLRKTKILVLDEATAAVDMETDDLIQKTIRSEFKDCTVLTIAHRLNTIIDYDRVMVLDKGHIKEFDAPSVLLADRDSIFHGMAKDAGLV